MQHNIIKKFLLVGVLLTSFFAATGVASAAFDVQYSSNGGPWQSADQSNGYQVKAAVPLTVRVTYYRQADPNGGPGDPELTSYRWSCDSNGANQTDSTGPSVTCSYRAPSSYGIRLEGTGPSGSYNPGVGVSALDPSDVHRPIKYIGPTTLYRSTIWGIQSPKPIVNASLYAGNGGFGVDRAKCPATMPAGTHCFRLGPNSPTRRSVLIEAYASTFGSDDNADIVDQHVQVLPDPVKVTTSRYHVKRHGTCTYGARLTVRTGVPATASTDVLFQMRLRGRWTTVGHQRRTKRYGPSVSTTRAQVRFGPRGTVARAITHRASFRLVSLFSVTDGNLNYYHRTQYEDLSAAQVDRCSF